MPTSLLRAEHSGPPENPALSRLTLDRVVDAHFPFSVGVRNGDFVGVFGAARYDRFGSLVVKSRGAYKGEKGGERGRKGDYKGE